MFFPLSVIGAFVGSCDELMSFMGLVGAVSRTLDGERWTLDLRVWGSIPGACVASFIFGKDSLPPISSLYPGVCRYQFY